MLIDFITMTNWLILYYLIVISAIYVILLGVSIPDIVNRFKENEIGNIIPLMNSHALPPVTIIIPAFNEQGIILQTVESLLKTQYPNTFIIIVSLGSTDKTLSRLITTYNLFKTSSLIQQKIPTSNVIKNYFISQKYPNLTVIDMPHIDRSEAMNIAINACHTPLFISIDGDTLVEPDAISNIVYYALRKIHQVVVGGALYILNGCHYKNGQITNGKLSSNPIVIFQTCEYLRSFLFSRSGWNSLGGAMCYAGAFTLFNYNMVVEIGGFQKNNLAQDFEIVTHIHADRLEKKLPYQIGFTPSAVGWTDVPRSLKSYWKQRFHWQYYSLKSLDYYVRMLFNYKYGIVGLFTYPFFLFGEILGALVEFIAYISVLISWYLGILDPFWAIAFFILCLGFISFLTMASVLLNYVTFNKYHRIQAIFPIFLF